MDLKTQAGQGGRHSTAQGAEAKDADPYRADGRQGPSPPILFNLLLPVPIKTAEMVEGTKTDIFNHGLLQVRIDDPYQGNPRREIRGLEKAIDSRTKGRNTAKAGEKGQ